MTDFTLSITDERLLDGITAARETYNNSLPATVVDAGGDEIPNPAILDTDEEYVQFVMSKAAESYANQYGL